MMASIYTHDGKANWKHSFHFFLLLLSFIKYQIKSKKAQERHNKAHETEYEYLPFGIVDVVVVVVIDVVDIVFSLVACKH